jgi:hypothetical protein
LDALKQMMTEEEEARYEHLEQLGAAIGDMHRSMGDCVMEVWEGKLADQLMKASIECHAERNALLRKAGERLQERQIYGPHPVGRA